MRSKWMMIFYTAMVATTNMLGGSADDNGAMQWELDWHVPAGGAAFYKIWAAGKQFQVGDDLIFVFLKGEHNVAEVPSQAAFDSCNIAATQTTINDGPAAIKLTTSGQRFFICAIAHHCRLGQKVAINVSIKADGPAPTSIHTPPPPSHNSGPPLTAFLALPAIISSIAMAAFFLC